LEGKRGRKKREEKGGEREKKGKGTEILYRPIFSHYIASYCIFIVDLASCDMYLLCLTLSLSLY